MVKIPIAQKRIYTNIFVCKNCQIKKRATPKQILEKKVKCRSCGKKDFRTIKKK